MADVHVPVLHVTEVNGEICGWIKQSKLMREILLLSLRVRSVAHGIETNWSNLQLATNLATSDGGIKLGNSRMTIVRSTGGGLLQVVVVHESGGSNRNSDENDELHGFDF